MTAFTPTNNDQLIAATNPALTATEALRTGLFHPINNADPDLGNRVKISRDTPTFFDRIFGR